MTESTANKPSLSRAIHSKLNALRRAVSRWLFVRGLSIVLMWFVLMLLLDFGLDWFFPMDLSQRVVVLIIILGVCAFLFFRHLVRPMLGRLDDDTLALRVEAGHKELGQRLISALQFSRVTNPEALGVSPAMVNATIQQGNDVANQVKFDDVLDRKVFNRNLIITVVMLLVLGGGAVGVMASDLLNAWFKRNVLLADVRYPRETFYGVLDEITEMTLPRGDDWIATVNVTGVIPENMYLDFEPVVGSSITQQMIIQAPKKTKLISPTIIAKPAGESVDKKPDNKKADPANVDDKKADDAKPDETKAGDAGTDGAKADDKEGVATKADGDEANATKTGEKAGEDKQPAPEKATPEKSADTKPADTKAADSETDETKPADKTAQAPVVFTTVFKNVLHPFRFRVRGDDRHSASHWIRVTLVDRPSIDSFNLTLTPPDYTGEGPKEVWAVESPTVVKEDAVEKDRGEGAQRRATGSSSVYALKGSSIRFTATSNKPLSRVVFKAPNGEEDLQLEQIDGSDFNGNPHKFTKFTASLPAEHLADATYTIELFDTSPIPLASKRPTRFSVRMKADREPIVKAQLRGISSMIVADARIPIAAYLRDDYHITMAGVSYRYRGEGEEAGKGEGMFEFDQLKYDEIKFNKDPIKYDYNFEVVGLKLKEGMSLSFLVEATDNDNIGGPNKGRSPEFYVRVVSEQELREDLNRREQEQRMEFERLIRAQEDLITETRVVISQTTPNSSLTAEIRQLIMQAQKRQKLAGDRCVQIARQYDNLMLEYLNNKLEDEAGPTPRRMSNLIINPLTRIGVTTAKDIATSLDNARKAPDGSSRLTVLHDTARQQEALLKTMKDILLHMDEYSGYQEAVTMIYRVLDGQDKVNRETIRAHQKRIQSIFGPSKDDKPDDKPDDKKDDN